PEIRANATPLDVIGTSASKGIGINGAKKPGNPQPLIAAVQLELVPPHLVPCQNLAHGVDELVLGDRELRVGLFLQVVLAVLAQAGDLGGEDEVLDLDFTLGFFVSSLDHDAGTAALVGVFHLRAEFAVTQIELGTNLLSRRVLSVAQLRHQALIVGNGNVGKYRHHDRPRLGFALDLAEMWQRRNQPRHADGESGRRHGLTTKTFNQSVVAPTTADRAETDGAAVVTFDLEGQLNFINWARVILEAT